MPKKRWIAGMAGLAAALGYGLWTNRRLWTVHDITTGESTAYPELRSRVYYAEPGTVLVAAEKAITTLPHWEAAGTDPVDHVLDCLIRTPFGGSTDDVTVYLTPIGHGQTRAVIRSRSRRGYGDLGRNAAHIRALQGAMDLRLTSGAAI